jgi:hypothetical protein
VSRTSALEGVRPDPSKVRENRGSAQTRFAMAARWIPWRMISVSLVARRLAASLMIARSSGSA